MVKNKLVRFEVADSQAGGQRRPFAKAVRAGVKAGRRRPVL